VRKRLEKEERKLLQSNGNRRGFHGKKANCPETEEKLCEYINDEWLFGYAVSIRMCQLKVSVLVKEHKM
jgi:hypothetical protein